jgi:peptidoglycan hydrolase CwlO-like protein
MTRFLFIGLVILALIGLAVKGGVAEDCSGLGGEPLYGCLGRQIDELAKQLSMSKAATAPLEGELNKLDTQIKSIQKKINEAVVKQVKLEKSIDDRSEQLGEQYVLFVKKTREMYRRLRGRTVLSEVLSSVSSGERLREFGYHLQSSDDDRQIIIGLSSEIVDLEDDKKELEIQKKKLGELQSSLDKQASFFRAEVAKAKKYQGDLSGKIAQLSSQQQSILAEKQGTFQTSVGDVPLADDPASRPDFNPGFSPAFAVFSFGAPHFKGMSQYGAYGRAKSGQNVEEILRAYYGGGVELKKDYSTSIQIKVNGFGSVDIETYAKRIYEMPGSWGEDGGMEALKAQAVAARSYALAYTDNGKGSICATESCQVYKNANKGGKWDEAVNATKGWVLVSGGKPFKAWYASTSGGYQESYTDTYSGYTTPGFWDAVGGRSGWTGQAYEKIAGSPWFYKAWYKSRTGDACGRSHPWLTSEEMADILNAWSYVVKSGNSDSRVTPLGGCWGGNPYSIGELREKGGFESVSAVSVSYSDGGYTANVHFETSKGGVDMPGADFKKAFNLRSPGRISVKSGLFNIEKK